MSVFKNKTQGNFTVVYNGILKDKNLNLKERGMLITLLSLPDNWEFTSQGLCEIIPEGIDAVNSVLRSLIKKGYLSRYRERNEKGLLGRNVIEVFEKPTFVGKLDMDNPSMENPNMDNPNMGNSNMETPDMENPSMDNPNMDSPLVDKPKQDNPAQSNTEVDKTLNIYNTNSINHSPRVERTSEPGGEENRALLAKNLNYDERAKSSDKGDFSYFTALFDVMLDFVTASKEGQKVRIANKVKDFDEVKHTLLNMKNDQMDYAIARLKEADPKKIVAFKPYALTILFNAAQMPVFIKTEKSSKSSFCKMEEHDYDFKAIEKALCR